MIKKLECATLIDALKSMQVGEIRLAPDGYSSRSVIAACGKLRKEGLIFTTSQRCGEQTITRLK